MLLLRDVQRRYSRRGGRYLAAGLAFLGFVALFPILLVGTAVATWIFSGDPGIVDGIIDTLGLGPDTSELVNDLLLQGQESATAATLVGFVGMVWTGMGMAGAVAHLYDVAWGVESRGLVARFIGLGWLAGAGILFVGSVAVTGIFIDNPWLGATLGLITGFMLFLWTSIVLPNRGIHWPSALIAAVVGAIGFQVLTWAGAIVLPLLLDGFSSLYGSLGVVFALLTWIYLLSLLVTYVAMIEGTIGKRSLGEMTAEVTAIDFPYPN